MKRFGFTPSHQFGVRELDTDFGVEIEVEGRNLPGALDHYFDVHQDGSLRAPMGGQALEYVFKKPYKRDWATKAILYLDKKMKDNNADPVWSYRTSVHVHVNASNLTFTQIYTWLCVYFILEDLLTEYCGKHRVGNLFCLRAKDAEWIIDNLREAALHDSPRDLNNENMRYAACNTVALAKFGTLEFRALRGTTDPEIILPWMDMLMAIKEFSMKFEDPRDVVQSFSAMGPAEFLMRAIGRDNYFRLNQQNQVENRMYEGMRLAQDIAFAVKEWPKKGEVPANKLAGKHINQVLVDDAWNNPQPGDIPQPAVNFDQWMNQIRMEEMLANADAAPRRRGRVLNPFQNLQQPLQVEEDDEL